MEVVRSYNSLLKTGSGGGGGVAAAAGRTRLQVWFIRVCTSILLWMGLVQLVAVGELWHPRIIGDLSNTISSLTRPIDPRIPHRRDYPDFYYAPLPPFLPAARNYTYNGYLRVSCNGGLNQMSAEVLSSSDKSKSKTIVRSGEMTDF